MSRDATPTSARWIANPLWRWSISIILAVIGGALAFEVFDVSVFQRIGMAHEYSYQREPRLIWLHVISDILIGLAYISIAATLAYLVSKASRGIPFNGVFLAFGLFIVASGLTHFMEVWVVWEPVYWMSGYVKVVTATAAVGTAIALFPLVPKIFQLIDNARQSERRRIEIEQLNGELERFNYSVAHDLRAPLRGIRGFGQALREDFAADLPPLAQGYIEKMQRSAAQMDTLICDLLKYATISRQELLPRPVALPAAIHSALALLDAEIQDRGARVDVPDALPRVLADSTLLQVIFENLIGNAVKFVAPGVTPQIEIAALNTAGQVRISVTDNGLGLPEGARAQVFRIFERMHPSHAGTGIGLAIVHRAVERLGGRVGVEAAPSGTGTRFWFELPAA